MPPKTKSYSADYKLRVVKYAAENGNRAAERKFGVSEKLVRDWRKAEATLTAMKATKKAHRGLKARWSELEERVHRWVLEQRAAGRGLSTVQLRLHAQVVAKAMNINDFAGGSYWCYRFMQRNRLSIRARTTMDKAWTSVTTETILSGFRKAGLIGTGTDAESDDHADDSHAEEEAALNLPRELAELFRSDTEDEEFNGFSDLE